MELNCLTRFKPKITTKYSFSNMIIQMIFLLIILQQIDHVTCIKFTERSCDFKAFPRGGCEEPEMMTCIDGKCACREESHFILLGRFCVEKLCLNDEWYDSTHKTCVKQSKASTEVSENHCRYDYQCYGSHVKCLRFGWNRVCKCDPGFSYDSLSKSCLPKHGIGGHCVNDIDCDDTALRKMHCDFNIQPSTDETDGQQSNSPVSSSNPTSAVSGGTCQCIKEHRYNYNIDGCEAFSEIQYRESNMRALVLMFVLTGVIFGLAMTCNLGICGSGPRPYEVFMTSMKTQDRIRQLREERSRKMEEGRLENSENPRENDTLTMVDGGRVPKLQKQQSIPVKVEFREKDDVNEELRLVNGKRNSLN